MRKLAVISAASWKDYANFRSPSGELIFEHKLQEHYTRLFFNFIKYGFVDEVHQFILRDRYPILYEKGALPMRARLLHPRFRRQVDTFYEDELSIEVNGRTARILHIPCESFEEIIHKVNIGGYQAAFFRSDFELTEKLTRDIFVMVITIYEGVFGPSRLQPDYHHFAFTQGESYFQYIPEGIPRMAIKMFSSPDAFYPKRLPKSYDWVWLTSFDPRKRLLDFLENLASSDEPRAWSGLVLARDPRNKIALARSWDSYRSFQRYFNRVKEFRRKLKFEILLNPTLEQMRANLSKSKIHVCVSKWEAGPRSMLDAMQCGLPVLTMRHIGYSDVIEAGVSGEVISDFEMLIPTAAKMIADHHSYNVTDSLSAYRDDNYFPKIIDTIKQEYRSFRDE